MNIFRGDKIEVKRTDSFMSLVREKFEKIGDKDSLDLESTLFWNKIVEILEQWKDSTQLNSISGNFPDEYYKTFHYQEEGTLGVLTLSGEYEFIVIVLVKDSKDSLSYNLTRVSSIILPDSWPSNMGLTTATEVSYAQNPDFEVIPNIKMGLHISFVSMKSGLNEIGYYLKW